MFKKILGMVLLLCMLATTLPVLAQTPEISVSGTAAETDIGNYEISVVVENPVAGAVLVAALYQDEVLTGLEPATLTASSTQVNIEVEAEKANSGKLFVWKSLENPTPIGKAGNIEFPAVANLIVKTAGASISAGEYNNVTIASTVANGDVNLNDVTVNGDLTIMGGGSNSIHLDSCTVKGKVIMNKANKEDSQPPRLNLNNTILATVEVQAPAIVEAEDETSVVDTIVAKAEVTAASDAVQKIEIPKSAPANVEVTVTGDEPVDIEVNSTKGVAVSFGESTGDNVTVSTALETAPENITVGGTAVAHVHKWGEPTTTPSGCETAGSKQYTCIAEGCETPTATKTEILHKLGHSYGEWKKLDDDYHTRSCAANATHTEKEKHNWDAGVVTTQPSETEEGVKTYTCSVCNGTKTETIPVLVTGKYEFIEDDGLRVSWKEATLAESEKYLITIKEPQSLFNTSRTDLPFGAFLAREDLVAGKVTFQVQKGNMNWKDVSPLYDEKEIANVTLNDTTPNFSIEKNSSGIYQFVSDLTGGAWVYTVYDENGNLTYIGNAVGGAIDTYANFAVGCKVTARYITWTLNDDKTYAEISVSNLATYTYNEDASGSATISLIQEGDIIKATWPDLGYTKYYVKVLDSNGTTVCSRACYNGYYGIENICDILPATKTGTETYSLVVYAVDDSYKIGEELVRLDNAIQVTVSGEALAYDMAFNSPATGKHTVSLTSAALPLGLGMRRFWYDGTGEPDGHGYSSPVSASKEVSKSLEDGYAFDLRIVTSVSLDGQKVVATMTPPSTKVYQSNTATNLRFEQYGSSLYCLAWDGVDATGPNGTYYSVMATSDEGTTWKSIGDAYYEKKFPMFFDEAASYDGLKVLTFINNEKVGEIEALDLSVISSAETSDTVVSADFNLQSDSSYQVDLNEITANTYFNFYLTASLNPISIQKIFSTTANGSGSSSKTITNATQIQLIENGYYLIKEFRNYTLSQDGKSLTYDVVTRGNWNQCIQESLNGLSFRKWSTDIMFDGYDDVKALYSIEIDGTKIVSSYVSTMSELLFDYDQSKGNITDGDFVIEIDDTEKERITDNVDVTISDKEVGYTINTDGTLSFDDTANGTYAYEVTKDSTVTQKGRIVFENGVLKDGWTLPVLENGSTISIMHIDCTLDDDGKTITATISPLSTKTYTEASTSSDNIRLVMDGNYLSLIYDDEEALASGEQYYLYGNGEFITSDTLKEMELTWLLPGISESKTISYEIKKGTWTTQEDIAKLESALNITVTDTVPDIQLTPQADGTYKITSDATDTGYFYRVKTPEGNRLATDYTLDGTFSCAIYEGCTVEIQTGTINVAEDGLSADITMSPVVTIANPTLHTGLNTVVEVDTKDELFAAVNQGAIATLTADITTTETLKFKTGAPAAIDLNGHTLTAPNVRVYYGKELIIDGTDEGSAIAGQLTTQMYAKLTINGGTYQKLQINDTRELTIDGIVATDNNKPVYISRCEKVSIANSDFTATYEETGYIFSALQIVDTELVELNNVNATAAYFGADINRCNQVAITNSTFAGGCDGIRILGTTATLIDTTATSENGCAILAQDGGVVVVKSGTYTGRNSLIQLAGSAGNVEVHGGTFTTTTDLSNLYLSLFSLNEDATHNTRITGGTFNKVDHLTSSSTTNFASQSITGGTFSFDPTEYVDTTTYAVTTNSDGTYTVTEK